MHHPQRNGSGKGGGNNNERMNTSRRIFRGRSGPQDGNLPPPRRRRGGGVKAKQMEDKEENNQFIRDLSSGAFESEEEEEEELIIINNNENISAVDNQQKGKKEQEQENIENDDATSSLSSLDKELHNLKRRIRHVRESVQQSDSLANQTIWENNCLNAVRNCALGWRSIVKHYGPIDNSTTADNDETKNNEQKEDENHSFDITDVKSKTMSLHVYELVQMSMQCGPLVGSKPAYFRRCGVQVVKIALHFLCTALIPSSMMESSTSSLSLLMQPLLECGEKKDECTKDKNDNDSNYNDDCSESEEEENYKLIQSTEPCHEHKMAVTSIELKERAPLDEREPHQRLTILTRVLMTESRFTERQANTIQTWMKDAEKEIRKNRSPSKSALKLQENGISKKKKKKKKHDTEKRRRYGKKGK